MEPHSIELGEAKTPRQAPDETAKEREKVPLVVTMPVKR